MPDSRPQIVVAVPARNEAVLLPRCLAAIEGQTGVDVSTVRVVVLTNNCTDGTADTARRIALHSPLVIDVLDAHFPEPTANAGSARRLAMASAAGIAAESGILVSTDADATADPDWLSSLSAAFGPGIDAVAGRVSGDWGTLQHFPASALETGAQEWRYQAASAELEALIDPVAHDPWPRHNQRCGANFAVRRSAWDRAGGIPPVPVGEDRAFLHAVERAGGGVRHAMQPHVTASARLVGRAAGGMAATLAARHAGIAAIDTDLERADSLVLRLQKRASARAAFLRLRPAGESFATIWDSQMLADRALAPDPIVQGGLASELARIEAHLADWRRIQSVG